MTPLLPSRSDIRPFAIAVAAAAGGLAISLQIAEFLPLSIWSWCFFTFLPISFFALASGYAAPVATKAQLYSLAIPLATLCAFALWNPPADAPLPALVTLASLLWAGSMLGAALGAQVRAPGHLCAAAIVSSLTDIVSVLHPSGPTRAIVQSKRALSLLVLPWAMPGESEAFPTLGVGDVVFIGFYFAATRHLSLRRGRTTVALAAALIMTGLMLLLLKQPLPALPAMGIAMIAAHPEIRALSRSEKRQLAVGLALLIVVIALLVLLR